MVKHTITITFGASERFDVDGLMYQLGARVLEAHGVGVEIDHAQQWIDDTTGEVRNDPR